MAKLGQDNDRVRVIFGARAAIKGIFTGERPSAEIFFRLIHRVSSLRRLNLVSFR
jgi:hypothetical protein